MAGFYLYCNHCGGEFGGPAGARTYLDHIAAATYYGARIMPEVTYGMSEYARTFLGEDWTLAKWIEIYYPEGADKATAFGYMMGLSFKGYPKSPAYQAWRDGRLECHE